MHSNQQHPQYAQQHHDDDEEDGYDFAQPTFHNNNNNTYGDGYTNSYPGTGYDEEGQAQPSFVPNPYAENRNMSSYEQGYAHREGIAARAAAASTAASAPRDNFGFLKSKWPAAFMAVSAIQALICLAFEAYVFGKFQTSLGRHIDSEKVQSQYLTIPTFLTLFIFGFLYECVVVWDALRKKNTIQIIGVCIANLMILVYTAIQVDQINKAIDILGENDALESGVTAGEIWGDVRPYLVAGPIINAVATIVMGFIAWKLYQVFAWDILKIIGADYRMKKRYFYYQVYIALLKFDFFFFLGFIVQFVVVVAKRNDPEFALTIATIPVTIGILLIAAYSTRHENKYGTIGVIILYLGGLSYFIFKLFRIYEPSYAHFYIAVRRSLTAFAVITICLIVCTIANAIVCMANFNKGLREHLIEAKKSESQPDIGSINMENVKPQTASRMSIE